MSYDRGRNGWTMQPGHGLNHAVHRRNDCQAETVGTITNPARRSPATFNPSKAHVKAKQLTSAMFLAGAKLVPPDAAAADAGVALKSAIGLQLITLAVNVLPAVLHSLGLGPKTVAFPLDSNENTNVLLTPPTVVPAGVTFAGVGAANLPVCQLLRMPIDNNACALATMCAALSSQLERRPANERNPKSWPRARPNGPATCLASRPRRVAPGSTR